MPALNGYNFIDHSLQTLAANPDLMFIYLLDIFPTFHRLTASSAARGQS